MTISDICTSEVITINDNASVKEAAALMHKHNIGDVVVTTSKDGKKACGIITDRDIAIKVVATGKNAAEIKVAEVITKDLLTIQDTQTTVEVIDKMANKAIRRLPIVNAQGEVCGIITVDDLLLFMLNKLKGIANILAKQVG